MMNFEKGTNIPLHALYIPIYPMIKCIFLRPDMLEAGEVAGMISELSL